MSALRVARGFTGRDLTIKFEGCYHGHVDSLLVKAGSGMATLGIADTAGVSARLRRDHYWRFLTIPLPLWKDASRSTATNRRGDRRAGGRQHGLRPARAGISRRVARTHRAARRVADFRRSDDRFPRGTRRRATAFRNPARPDDARQDYRRRSADRGVWRPRRHHEQESRRSGRFIRRDAFRESAVGAAGLAMLRYLTLIRKCTNIGSSRRAVVPMDSARHHHQPRRRRCSRCSSRPIR